MVRNGEFLYFISTFSPIKATARSSGPSHLLHNTMQHFSKFFHIRLHHYTLEPSLSASSLHLDGGIYTACPSSNKLSIHPYHQPYLQLPCTLASSPKDIFYSNLLSRSYTPSLLFFHYSLTPNHPGTPRSAPSNLF